MINESLAKKYMLSVEAGSYAGIRETTPNDSDMIRKFQSVIGVAQQESWCLSFVQYCVEKVDRLYFCVDPNHNQSTLMPTEHCLTLWRFSPERRKSEPCPGLIAIWQHGDTAAGHAGIVEMKTKDGFYSMEGNSNEAGSREGDGVYRKKRLLTPMGNLKLLGFIDPWP